MDLLGPLRSFDHLQRRHSVLAIPVAVLRNFSDQGAGDAAALIAYWGFFSLFPLLLVFVTILGFVLQGDPAAQASVLHSLTKFPIIGSHVGSLRGSGVGLGIGIAGTVWSGLSLTVAVENAFLRVYAIPLRDRPNFLSTRWRGLKLLAAVGVLQVLSTVAAGVVSGGLGGVLLTIAGITVSLLLNFCLFFVVFRFLIPNSMPTRQLWPGITVATVGWTGLQSVGGIYVAHVVKGAGQTYGTFATVIGLLAWLYLGARVLVYAAEINVVLTRQLWPRSILDPPEPADRAAHTALAKMQERADETIVLKVNPASREEKGERAREPRSALATAAAHRARPQTAQVGGGAGRYGERVGEHSGEGD